MYASNAIRCFAIVMADNNAIIDELLCFISWKLQVLTTDELVKVCADTFTEANIVESKLRLFTASSRGPGLDPVGNGIKFTRRQGDKRIENNLKDIIMLFQELGADAPKFAAADLNILPKCDTVNAHPSYGTQASDIQCLLKAISDLRSDVSALTKTVASQQETISELVKAIADNPNTTYASVCSKTTETPTCSS